MAFLAGCARGFGAFGAKMELFGAAVALRIQIDIKPWEALFAVFGVLARVAIFGALNAFALHQSKPRVTL